MAYGIDTSQSSPLPGNYVFFLCSISMVEQYFVDEGLMAKCYLMFSMVVRISLVEQYFVDEGLIAKCYQMFSMVWLV